MTPTPKRTKTIAIVGNAPVPGPNRLARFVPSRIIARRIDACDLVLRCNEIKNRNSKWIGTRTDILVVRECDSPGYRMSQPGGMGIPASLRPKRVLFTGETLFDRSKLPFEPHPGNFREGVIQSGGFETLPVEEINREAITEPASRLIKKNMVREPSSGMLGIFHVLTSPDFQDYLPVVVGFQYKGWPGHALDAERELVREWAKEGRVRYLI